MANDTRRQQMMETILGRRTVRKFTDQPVPDQTLEQVLHAAMYAPTRAGSRPWHFVVIRRDDTKRALAGALRMPAERLSAPVLVAVCAETTASGEWDLDAAAATENLLVAATALGLGSAWLASQISNSWSTVDRTFRQIVGAPDNVELVALIALGYPEEKPAPRRAEDRYDGSRVHFENMAGPAQETEQFARRRAGDWRQGISTEASWKELDVSAGR